MVVRRGGREGDSEEGEGDSGLFVFFLTVTLNQRILYSARPMVR